MENNNKEREIKSAEEVLRSDDDFMESISEIEKALIIERMEIYASQFKPAIRQEIKSKEEYNPIGCDHKKDNGFSAWEVLSDSSGSGPDLDFHKTIMVCFKCGDIRCVGRELKHGKMNHFDEIFDIDYPDAVAAIVEACNWMYREDEDYAPFVRQPASQFTPIASKEVEYRKALLECKRYFGENDKTPAQHRMYEVVNKALKSNQQKGVDWELSYWTQFNQNRRLAEALEKIIDACSDGESLMDLLVKIEKIATEALNQ